MLSICVFSLTLSACGSDEARVAPTTIATGAAAERAPATMSASTDPAEGVVAVADITRSPEHYMGQTLVVQGQVDRVLGEQVFTLDEDAVVAAGIDNDLLVVGGGLASRPEDRSENSLVQVTGTLRPFDANALEQELGLTLEASVARELAGRPALYATSLSWIDDESAVELGPPGSAYQVIDLAAGFAGLLGRTVTVEGVVQERLGAHALVLTGDADTTLLVVAATETAPRIADSLLGRPVHVTGIVRVFQREVIETQVGYELDAERLARWENEAVLVAQVIEPTASVLEGAAPAAVAPAPPAAAGAVEADGSVNGTPLADIVDDAAAWVGKTVTVRGVLAEALGPQTIWLGVPMPSTARMLVIARPGVAVPSAGMVEGSALFVHGEIWRFEERSVEAVLGVELADERLGDYENRPVIIADSIRSVDS
jgi:hypothetical protein